MDNYQQLIKFISENSGVSLEDIERKIEAKQAKFSGLISKEGAAQVIAAELNVNFDKQLIKISQMISGMRKVNLIGKIIEISPIRKYSKNGRTGRIASFILADDTSNIRVVLWDENHIDLIFKGEINENSFVEITNASIRNGELHLGSFSDIKISGKMINNIVIERQFLEKEIVNFSVNENVVVRAFIVNVFTPKFFEICPECSKKVIENECNEHGKVIPEKRCLLGLIIDDGTASIRATIFQDALKKLFSIDDLENAEVFAIKKQDFLGKEMIFKGQIRKNSIFYNDDFIINEIKDVDLDELIKKLEQ